MRIREFTLVGLLVTALALAAIPSAAIGGTASTSITSSSSSEKGASSGKAHVAKSTYVSGDIVYHAKSKFVDAGAVGGAVLACGANERMLSPGVMLEALDDVAGFTGGVSSLAFHDTDNDGSPDDQAIVNVWNRASRTNELTGWAVCLKGPARNDIAYKTTQGHIDSSASSISVGERCNAGRLAGIGGSVSGSPTESSVSSAGYALDGRKPVPDQASINWLLDAANFDYRLDVACVPTSTAVQKISVQALLPGEVRTFHVPCPAGTSAIGGGILGFASPLLGSAPYDSNDPGNAPDDGWAVRVATGNYAGFAIEAICYRN